MIKLFPSCILKETRDEKQEQAGFSDCGVLAIAVATSLCFGEDPTVARWEQAKMCAHLITCLEAEKMTPFPKDSNKFGIQEGTKSVIVEMAGTLHLSA